MWVGMGGIRSLETQAYMVSISHVSGICPEVTVSSSLFELCGIVWLTARP